MNKLIALILLFVTCSSSQQISVPLQYLQCNGGEGPEPIADLRGIPGKRGPTGEKGEVGFADDKVLGMISSSLESFQLQIDQLQRENRNLQTTQEQLIGEIETLKKNLTKTDTELQTFVGEVEVLKMNITTKNDAELQASMACRIPVIANLQTPTPGFYANHDLDTEVNFTCASTHAPRSSDVLQRQCNNGAWVPAFNSSSIVCQQRCTVPALKNGSATSAAGQTVNHGDNVNFTCDPDFSSPDVLIRTCDQGKFTPEMTSGFDPKCYSDCTLPTIANLKAPPIGWKVKHDAVVSTFACNAGYRLRSGQAPNRPCTDGVWSPGFDTSGLVCEPIPRTTRCAYENTNLQISCSANKVITIHSASYGRRNGNVCDTIPRACSYQVVPAVRSFCEDKTSCTVGATNGNFGDSCWGEGKYLTVTWSCQ